MLLTETKTYLLWESAGRKLAEAKLTPDQIQSIFQSVEQGITAGGQNRTLVGQGKDAASAVNKAWEDLKTKVQDSGPIRNLDAKYDAVAEKLKKATGGDQGVMQYVQKYRDFAKKHPVAQSLIYSALIAAAGISGAGVGGAAALGLLKMTDKLLQGQKFSSAAYAGAKTGGMAYAAGQIGQHFKNQPTGGGGAPEGAGTPGVGTSGATDATSSAAGGSVHTVGPDDTLASIAKDNDVDLDALKAANPDVTSQSLEAGQQINIPGGETAGQAAADQYPDYGTDTGPGAAGTSDTVSPDGATTAANEYPDYGTDTGPGAAGTSDTVSPTDVGQAQEYTVQKGDTLSQIAKDNNVSVKELQDANPDITDVHKIKAGQTINIPAQTGSPVYDQGVGLGGPTGAGGPQASVYPGANPNIDDTTRQAADFYRQGQDQVKLNQMMQQQMDAQQAAGNAATSASGSGPVVELPGGSVKFADKAAYDAWQQNPSSVVQQNIGGQTTYSLPDNAPDADTAALGDEFRRQAQNQIKLNQMMQQQMDAQQAAGSAADQAPGLGGQVNQVPPLTEPQAGAATAATNPNYAPGETGAGNAADVKPFGYNPELAGQAPKGAGMNAEYLKKVISGEQPRPMISAEDAQKALDWQAQNGGQIASAAAETSSKGFSPEYLQDVIAGKHPRPLVSVERAKELLSQMNKPVQESYVYLTPGVKLNKHQIQKVFIFTSMTAPIVNEGIWDTVKGAAGKAVDWAKTKGHNVTTKITADKLNSAWEKGGKPTDSNELFDLLVKYPVDKDILTKVFKDLNIDVSAKTQDDQGDQGQGAEPGQAAFSQMAAQLSGSNKSPSSTGGTTTKTPTGLVHTAKQGSSDTADLSNAWNKMTSGAASGGTGDKDDVLQGVQNAWAKARGKSPAASKQPAAPAAAKQSAPNFSNQLGSKGAAAFSQPTGSFNNQLGAKPAAATPSKPAAATPAKPAALPAPAKPAALPAPAAAEQPQVKKITPNFGNQTGTNANYTMNGKSIPKSAQMPNIGVAQIASRLAGKQQGQQVQPAQGQAALPAPAKPAALPAPAAQETPAKKKRTGGKVAGQVSQTPNAQRKRAARQAKKQNVDGNAVAESFLEVLNALEEKYSLRPRVLESKKSSISITAPAEKIEKILKETKTVKKSVYKEENTMKNVDKDVAAMLQSLKKYDMLAESVAPVLASKKVDETLGKSATAGEFIHDFVHSDDPKFSGDSKAERIKRALGAYYGEHPEKSRKEESLEDGSMEEMYMGEGMCNHCQCDPCECNESEHMSEDDMEEGAGVMHYKAQQAKAHGQDSFKLGNKEFPVKEGADPEVLEWMKRFSKLGKM